MEDILNSLILLTNFIFIPALSYGSQLALGALGVTLIYGILRFSNIAHGETMAFGAMITVLATWGLQSLGINLGPFPTALLALPIGAIATIALVLSTDRLVYKYYRDKKQPTIIFLILSIGVMFVMNGLIRFIIGPNDQRFSDGERFIIRAKEFKNLTGLNEGITIKMTQGLTIVITLLVVWGLFRFLQHSKMGRAMRAYADNEDLALLSGINPDQVVRVTWAIAAVLATIAGVLYGLDKSFKPFTYFQLLLPIFAAAIVGGVGNPVGAILGGYVIAFSEVAVTYAYKKFFKYLGADPDSLLQFLSTDYKFDVSFIILVVVLLVKPTGILKGRVLE